MIERDKLTKNQSLVFAVLSKSGKPVSAYTILDSLREQGFRAPLQVYRALSKLREFGLIHRLCSINAFVACADPGCSSQGTTAFAICDDCGQVDEISRSAIQKPLQTWLASNHFTAENTAIEIRGKCRECRV